MTRHTSQTISMRWQGIEIEITYHPCWTKLPDGAMSRLEIRSAKPQRARLPITETGYLSRFFHADELEAGSDIAELVREWLDERAKCDAWKAYREQSRQLTLF